MTPLIPRSWVSRFQSINRANLDCRAGVYAIPDGSQSGDVDSAGNVNTDRTLVASDLPCRVSRWGTQPLEGVVADQATVNSRWVVTFDVGERRVQSGHLLEVSGSTNGVPWVRSLVVIEPLDPTSIEVMTQVLCDEA